MPDSSGREMWRYLHLGTEIAVLALLGAWLGRALDRRWGSEPWCMVGGVALGFTIGLYHLIRAAVSFEDQKRGREKDKR